MNSPLCDTSQKTRPNFPSCQEAFAAERPGCHGYPNKHCARVCELLGDSCQNTTGAPDASSWTPGTESTDTCQDWCFIQVERTAYGAGPLRRDEWAAEERRIEADARLTACKGGAFTCFPTERALLGTKRWFYVLLQGITLGISIDVLFETIIVVQLVDWATEKE